MGQKKRITILFFIETLTGGGAEKVLCNLVNHLDQKKFDITVQTVWPCDAKRLLVAGIHYKSSFTSSSKSNRLRYRAEAAAGLFYQIHIKDNYDIECAYLEMGPTKIMASSTNRHAKKLAWVHCDLSRAVSDPQPYVKKAAPWYAKFDQIVCVSESVRERFDELFQNAFPSTVLYNVIDDDVIRSKALAPMPVAMQKRRVTVLSVGRFSQQKNFIRLLKTHKRLLGEGLEHDLWILGDGAQREMLERFIVDHHLSDSVWMPGFVDNPYPYLRSADLLVCSSDFEGYSTFMTEGVILARPIVTTDVSGMRELLGNSEYGLIVENDDQAFYQGLKRMLQEPNLREHYASKAFERSSVFSAEQLTMLSEQYFSSLVCRETEQHT